MVAVADLQGPCFSVLETCGKHFLFDAVPALLTVQFACEEEGVRQGLRLTAGMEKSFKGLVIDVGFIRGGGDVDSFFPENFHFRP